MNELIVRTAAAAIAILACAPAVANPLQECRAIADAAGRLECYDRLADRDAASVPAAKGEAPEPVRSIEATGMSQEALFGKTQEEIRETVRAATGDEDLAELQAAVVAVRKSPTGHLVVELDNSQTWIQIDTSRLRLAPGNEVVIRKASLGSFLLSRAGSKRSMRVRRSD